MKLFSVMILCVFLIGCGADEEELEESFEISDKAPSISIVKIRHEVDRESADVAYKLVADSTPKYDILVLVRHYQRKLESDGNCFGYPSHSVVIIPKGKKESQDIEINGLYGTASAYIAARVEPLPIVDIVGEGEKIDQQALQGEYGGHKTYEGKTIPQDFMFHYYEVAESEPTVLYTANSKKERCAPNEDWVYPEQRD